MEIKDKIKDYFKMTEEEKEDILLEIIDVYIQVYRSNKHLPFTIVDLIERDIKIFENDEEFETAQALQDLLLTYHRVERELRDEELLKIVKQLENKDKDNGL